MLLLSKNRAFPRRLRSAFLCCGSALLFLTIILLVALKRRGGTDDYASEEFERPNSETQWRSDDPLVTSFPLVETEFKPGWFRRFYNEDARVVGFPASKKVGGLKEGKKKAVIYLATPYFGEWKPKHYYFPQLGQTTFRRYLCPVDECHVTKDPSQASSADAVLFHVRDLEVFSLPANRSPEQVWILYSMEPPWLEVKDMRRFEGVFNWTMSYRSESDVVIRYGFVGRRKKSRTEAVPRMVPDRKSDRALWLVSNCNSDSNREGFVERLRRVFPVDVRGGCGSVDGCRPAETGKCYRQMALTYKFYLAFENAICADYVTEKLFNALEYFMIPVTLGGGDYARLAPPHSTIDALQFASPEELGRYLWKVSRNDSLYLSYFEWRRDYRSYLQPWMCDLCETLHRRHRGHRTRHDLERWWHGDKPCHRWTGGGFGEVRTHAFPRYHLKLFE